MDNIPFISIGIASYNYEEFIIRELDSIKKQAFKDYEVVICDDFSTDNSVTQIEKYISANSQMKIKLITNNVNLGILKTKSRLINECIGKYIMICDSDDWMADNCLEVLAGAAIRDDADRVIAEVYDINEKGKILQIQDLPQNPSKWLSTLHHGTLYRRSIFIENNITFKCMPDDAYVILKFNQYCRKISFIHEPIYYWYVHDKSEGRNKNKTISVKSSIDYFRNIIEFSNETLIYLNVNEKNSTELGDDVEKIKLLLLKLYYNHILQDFQRMSLKNAFNVYLNIRKIMINNDANYLNNKYLHNEKKAPIRKYAYKIIKICTILEKNHLMCFALFIYRLLTHFIYFDQ